MASPSKKMSLLVPRVNTWEDDSGAVPHRLRGSIATLRLLVEGLRDGIVDPARDSRDTAEMLAQVRLVSELVDELAPPSRQPQRGIRSLSLQRLLAHWVTALRPSAAAASIHLSLDVPGDLAAVRADAHDLSRVVLTLVHNAMRHSPTGGTVLVRALEVGEVVEVRVDDAGPGIALTDHRRVLEATTDAVSAAPAWGLPAARAIIATHGGCLWIADSWPGASVRFRLPIVRS